MNTHDLIPPHGGFRKLRSFRCAQVELANTLICLINQASYLLWQQLQYLEKEFLRSGGFTERMYHARKSYRNNQ